MRIYLILIASIFISLLTLSAVQAESVGTPFYKDGVNDPIADGGSLEKQEFIDGITACKEYGHEHRDCILRVPLSNLREILQFEEVPVRNNEELLALFRDAEVRECQGFNELYFVPKNADAPGTWSRACRPGEDLLVYDGVPLVSLNCGNPVSTDMTITVSEHTPPEPEPEPEPIRYRIDQSGAQETGTSFCLPRSYAGASSWSRYGGHSGIGGGCFSDRTSVRSSNTTYITHDE